MPFMSSFSGSFSGGRRSNSIQFGLSKRKKIIAHYSPGNSSSYGGSGATLVDLTNNNYDVTIVEIPTFITDSFLVRSGDYISTPSLYADIKSNSKSHTLEIWCYPTGDGVVAQYCGQATPNTGDHYSVIEIVSGQVEFGLWNGSAISSSGPTGSINLNSWNQIVLTYDGSHIRGFVNGQRVTKTSVSWSLPAASGASFVGLGGETLWISPSISGLNQTASDLSGNGNNGTLNGSCSVVAQSGKGGSAAFSSSSYSSDFVSVPNILPATTVRSVGCWVYGNTFGAFQLHKLFASSLFKMQSQGFGDIVLRQTLSASPWSQTYSINSNPSSVNGAWHHYCIVQDGTDAKAYLDGSLVSTTTLDPNVDVTGDSATIELNKIAGNGDDY